MIYWIHLADRQSLRSSTLTYPSRLKLFHFPLEHASPALLVTTHCVALPFDLVYTLMWYQSTAIVSHVQHSCHSQHKSSQSGTKFLFRGAQTPKRHETLAGEKDWHDGDCRTRNGYPLGVTMLLSDFPEIQIPVVNCSLMPNADTQPLESRKGSSLTVRLIRPFRVNWVVHNLLCSIHDIQLLNA